MLTPSHPLKRATRTRVNTRGRQMTLPTFRDADRAKVLGQRIYRMIDPLLTDNCHGYRRGRSVATAVQHIGALGGGCVSLDIKAFFSSINHDNLKRMVDGLDATLWHEVFPWLPATGLATGHAVSTPYPRSI